MLVTRKRSAFRNGRGPTVGKGNSVIEGQKGKFKSHLVEDDVTSKSSFEALEDTVHEPAREEVTCPNQNETGDTVENDMLSIQVCQAITMMDTQNKKAEAPLKKLPQNSKIRSSKNLGIKNPKGVFGLYF